MRPNRRLPKCHVETLTDRGQERAALALFLESVCSVGSIELVVHRDDPGEFPDFVLLNRATNREIWVEIVEAVESGELIAAARQAEHLYNAARNYAQAGDKERALDILKRLKKNYPATTYGREAERYITQLSQ